MCSYPFCFIGEYSLITSLGRTFLATVSFVSLEISVIIFLASTTRVYISVALSSFMTLISPFILKKHQQLTEVNPFPKQALIFTCLQCMSFENTVGKSEIARNEQFFLSHSVFYPFGELSAIFIKVEIVVCKLF